MKTRQKAVEMFLSVALCFALLCTVMVNLNYQVFAKNVAGCSTSNPQTYGEWLEVVPENGTFEAGYPGTDVYGWHLTAMSYGYTRLEDVNHSETDIQNYLNSYTLKTEKQDGNKYAVIRKDGGGYVALTSQPFKVNGGQVYKLKLDYFLRNIINPKENKLDTDFHGIRICMREYDMEGNATWTKLNYNGDEQGKILASDYNGNNFTSEDWKTINTGFIPAATTIKVELYIRVGGAGNVFGDVLFDNILVSEYDYFELQNGNFDAVTYVGEAGRGNEILGPAGWTTISCTAGGAVTTDNYVNNYAAMIVPDPDNSNESVLKYQYKNLTSTGYAFIQSPSISVVANSKFRASFRYKITGQMAYTPKATVFFYDADGNEISRHHTNLNKSQPQWLSKTTSEFTVPANAVSAKIGFFGSRQNSVNSSSYPAEYIYSEGGRNFDTYTLYFDDIIINGANSEWTSETTKTNGAPRDDSYDYTGHYTIEKVTDGATHKNALLLRASSSENGIGAVTYYSKPIKIEANTSYTATFDLKIEGFKADAETANGPMQARLFARYLDANGRVINTTPSIVYQSGYQNRDWTSYKNSFTTNGDAVAVQIGLLCGVTKKNTWDNLKFYWDNIRVVKTTEFDVQKAEKFDKTDLLFISMQGGS